jgi:fatty acid desaturase
MQVEASSNFEVSLPVSILCGALDKQIEHHLFPTLPPQRLRQIAPEVRAMRWPDARPRPWWVVRGATGPGMLWIN